MKVAVEIGSRVMLGVVRVVPVGLFLGLSLFIFAHVVLRYFLELSIFSSSEELSLGMAVWIYYLSIAYTTWKKGHIVVGWHFKRLEVGKTGAILSIGRLVLSIAPIILIAFYAFNISRFAIEEHFMSYTLLWPRVLWYGSLFVGYCLAGLVLVVQLAQLARQIRCGHLGVPGGER